jgi:hypothetical protein
MLLDVYYEPEELVHLAKIFDVILEIKHESFNPPNRKSQLLEWSQQFVEQLNHGNYRALVDTLLQQIDLRNTHGIGTTDWERRDVHRSMVSLITELREGLAKAGTPSEIAVAAGKPFTAKSHIRELLEQTTTPVLVVDPWIGSATLDCLRGVGKPIRILTSTRSEALEPTFGSALSDFAKEGFSVEVRRADRLHDRHLVFNERCWLLGSSLKDAGKKAFHCIEIVDSKDQVVADLESRWGGASTYP